MSGYSGSQRVQVVTWHAQKASKPRKDIVRAKERNRCAGCGERNRCAGCGEIGAVRARGDAQHTEGTTIVFVQVARAE
eukprot:3477533-Rhodomonas_salina.1